VKITRIAAQVKRAGRYSIYVDEKYAFSLSDTALLEAKLAPGDEITEAELKDWKQTSEDDKALGRAYNYALLRPRSHWEMEFYLKRKKAPPALIEQILNKLTNMQLLDDETFARAWVANRRLLRPTSLRKLQQELRSKRVSDEVVVKVLGEDETDENDVLKELIARKRKQSRYQDKDKLMRYLAGQGFGYSDIKTALEEDEET